MKKSVEGTGAEILARSLRALGVKRVFGVCGDHINALYHAISLEGIELIGVRHESAAVQMADGLARATGKPGIALVTAGPGHTNAVTGFAVAQSAGSPVVVISGQTPLDQRERGGQQVLYQADIVRSLTKWAQEVINPNHLAEYTVRAFQIAASDTPGPVSLSVPLDTLTSLVTTSADQLLPAYKPRLPENCVEIWPAAMGASVGHACQFLAAAERPVIIVGGGAWPDFDGGALAACVKRMAIPTFTIDQARGLLPDDGKESFGYADPFFNRTFRELKSADVLLLVGAAIDFHVCFGGAHLLSPKVRIVQIHRDARKIAMCRNVDVGIAGPVRPVLEHIATEHEKARPSIRPQSAWLDHVRHEHSKNRAEWNHLAKEMAKDASSIHPLQVCASLERHRTAQTAIIIDGGDFVHWPRAYFPAMRPGHWMDAALMGNLGGAVPLGIAAQIAFPKDPVWIFVGDGGFGFCCWELATAVEQKLPVKVILGNDHAWGIEKRLQLGEFGQDVGCDLPYVRYDQFAKLVGAAGFHVESPTEVDAVVDEFVATPGPCLLNVNIRRLAGRPLADFSRT